MVIRGIKCALSLCEICEDRMADPFQSLSSEERGRVEAILRECGLGPRLGPVR